MILQRTKLAAALACAAGDSRRRGDVRGLRTSNDARHTRRSDGVEHQARRGRGRAAGDGDHAGGNPATGATTPMELLQHISGATTAPGEIATISNSVGALTLSAQTASLRGLAARTLVLINGHARIASFAGEVQGVGGVNLATSRSRRSSASKS